MSRPTRSPRYGQPYGVKWKRIRDVASNETEPTAQGQCLTAPGEGVIWLVVIPAGVTALNIHVGRWVDLPTERGLSAISLFAEDEVVALSALSAAKTEQLIQDTFGDDVGIWIDGITGAGTVKIAAKFIGGGP